MNGYKDEIEGDEGHDESETDDQKLVDLQSAWTMKLEQAEKDDDDYRDEVKRSIKWLRLDKEGRRKKATGNKLNIAFANYEVMRSAIYARSPKIVVQPKFGGGPDREQLNAVSEVLERAVHSENERCDLHGSMKRIRDELLKSGRGVGWVRYEAEFGMEDTPVIDPATGAPAVDPMTGQPMMQQQKAKTAERVKFDVVTWRNFKHGAADCWGNVPWVSRCERLTKRQVKERFNIDAMRMEEIGISFGEAKPDQPKNTDGQTVEVEEVWCKTSRKVYFVVKGARQLVEPPSEPLIDVAGFYPCPEPAMSVLEDGTIKPVPDVIMIEDQLIAIDDMTARIRALEKALKVRGFYGKGAIDTSAADAIESAFISEDDRAVLIPVTAWAAGGQSKLDIVWLPIDGIIKTLTALRMERKESIDLVYQISGISDVMRGDSEASETLGAQQIKDRWGSVRTRDKQEEIRRMARDLCRIAAEVMCELFDEKSFAEAAVYGFDPQMLEFLRNDRARSMVLDIETDSTIQADEESDKASRAEFTTVVGALLEKGMPLVQQVPEAIDFVGSMIKFNVRGFRAGREVEKDLDAFLEAMKNKLSAPPQPQQPPQVDPAVQAKTEAEMARSQADVQIAQHQVARSEIDLQKAMIPSRQPAEMPLM